MSISKLSVTINIISATPTKDAEGFAVSDEKIIATVRAEKDDRHGSETQTNMATFSTAVTRFRFRRIPGVEVTAAHTIRCEGEVYRITSVLTVRGLVVEAMTEKIERSGR